jgi:hypothetical protein
VRNMQCNGTFAYQLGTFYSTEENHGTFWLSWPVAESCTRALTSKEQCGVQVWDC